MSLADLHTKRTKEPYLDWALDLYVSGKIKVIPKNNEQAKELLIDLGYYNLPDQYEPGDLGEYL